MSRHSRREFLKTAASTVSLATASAGAFPSLCHATEKSKSTDSTQVACYYFPGYHLGDPRIERVKGKGWSEWELMKAGQAPLSRSSTTQSAALGIH